MIDWYTDLIYEGKFRYLFNLITSAIVIAVVAGLAIAPETLFNSIIDNNPARMENYQYFCEFFYLPILSVIGVGFIFIGFDLMRDEFGFLGFVRIVCIVFGAMLAFLPQIVNAAMCSTMDYVGLGHVDPVAAALRALPRFGFFYAALSSVYYGYVGLADDYGFLDDFSPLFPVASAIISYLLSFGCAVVAIR